MSDQDTTKLLLALGLTYEDIGRLVHHAREDGQTLRELAAYILRDYAPPVEWSEQ